MTIGIAATGPYAGAGILAGLQAVEAFGHGAIGGFVSLAVINEDGELQRAETQRGGTRGLFPNEPPGSIQRAPYAGLISSGPDRPEPLSQFIAAAPGIGIVTGHRFPQIRAETGLALNAMVLEAMSSGASPQSAIDALIGAHPSFDAGFVALACNGALGLGNMPSVERRSDQGKARSVEDDRRVATIHNAILPHRMLADMVNEIVHCEMRRRSTDVQPITVSAGVRLRRGARPEIHVDDLYQAIGVYHPEAQALGTLSSFGLGDRVLVIKEQRELGWLGYEPYITCDGGEIVGMDGKSKAILPVLIQEGARAMPHGEK